MIRPAISVRGKTNMSVIKEYPELENVEITPTLEDQVVKSDMYGFDEVKVKGVSSYIDEDIKPEYIKEGVDILGVVGNFKGIDTSDATVDPSKMLVGQTAYANGEKIVGTMPNNGQLNYEPSKDPQVIPSGYTDGGSISGIVSEELNLTPGTEDQIHEGKLFDKVTMLGDANLLPENIKKGTTIFEITGSNTVVDTSDATALVTDIIVGKTAYVNGEKIEGTYEPLDTSDATATAAEIFKDKIAYVNGEKIVGTYEEAGGDNEFNAIITADASKSTTFSVVNSLQEINNLDLTGITSMSEAFSGCSFLKKIKSISNSSKVTNMYNAFRSCGIKVETGFEIEEFDTSNVTNMQGLFQYSGLIKVPKLNTSKVTNMSQIFANMEKLKDVSDFDFSHITSLNQAFQNSLGPEEFGDFNTINVENFNSTFYGCSNLKTLGVVNAEKANNINQALYGKYGMALQNFGGFKDLGKNYTQKTANYSVYKLDLSKATMLTHESLMNVINNLYDLNLTYDVANGGTLYTQQLVLGSTNLAKLTAEEIAIATNKGWTVS